MTCLETARSAALEAGAMLKDAFGRAHTVEKAMANDLKLSLDTESQRLITERLLTAHPDHAVLGEEGESGRPEAPFRWIVDPIDGTVNFFYGIPHFAVSIALSGPGGPGPGSFGPATGAAPGPGGPADSGSDPGAVTRPGPVSRSFALRCGIIYDPMQGELWSVALDGKGDGVPRLGKSRIEVSRREELSEAIVMVGFAKSPDKIDSGMERYRSIAPRVRKIRMLGSAALAMAYVAGGRLDAYVEETVSIWDIAAGTLLVEAAGGRVVLKPHRERDDRYSIVCSNGRIPIESLLPPM